MSMEIRNLTEGDLPVFIRMRMDQLQEEGAKATVDLEPALWDYYRRRLADGGFAGFVAVDGTSIVGTAGLSIVEKPPTYGNPSGKVGILSSMYTCPAYRRRGIARRLLGRAVEEARRQGCGAVQITASDMGVLLYTAFGFQKNGNFMTYPLQ